LVIQTDSTYDVVAKAVSMRGGGHAVGGIVGKAIYNESFSNILIITLALQVAFYCLKADVCSF